MHNNDIFLELLNDTHIFFNNIFTSEKLQAEYDLINYANRDFVLNKIKEFRDSPTACIIKPFYEKDYKDSNCPRAIIVRRNNHGFITVQLNTDKTEPSIIEPFRFVSIIKQLIEDENIKKEMYSEKINEADNSFDR